MSGTLTGQSPYIFTSDPIQCGDGYSASIDDVNNCNPVTVSGLPTCDCATEAGILDLVPIENCGSGPLTLNYLGGEILDANDVIGFILHDNPNNPLSNVLASKRQNY